MDKGTQKYKIACRMGGRGEGKGGDRETDTQTECIQGVGVRWEVLRDETQETEPWRASHTMI